MIADSFMNSMPFKNHNGMNKFPINNPEATTYNSGLVISDENIYTANKMIVKINPVRSHCALHTVEKIIFKSTLSLRVADTLLVAP